MNELTDKFARLQIGDSPNDSKTPTVAFGYHYGLLMSSKDPIHEGKTVFKNGFTNEYAAFYLKYIFSLIYNCF